MIKDHFLSPEEAERQQQYRQKVRAFLAESKPFAGGHYAYIQTFGCQQNEADSERLGGCAEAMGYDLTDDPKKAGLILVNTCAIREHAEKRALSIVGQYKHLKAANPDLVIGVCGCMVSQEHRKEEVKLRYPYVDLVFGTASLFRFPELLWSKLEKRKRIFCPEEEQFIVPEDIPVHRESNFKAWVSVMYGCNNFCSYCIVPYVRGRERSRRKEDIYAEVAELVKNGYKDITLLGQNVNSYGKDNDDGVDFADLLRLLTSIEGDYRLHFMTSHPKDATKKLIDVMAECEHIAPHFHLPMQSGSDRILEKMNRHYDTARYLDIVSYMRQKIPNIVITSDIIVGFPGETEEDFEATLRMLRCVKFDMLYSFIYSPRKGTPAADMPDQIPANIQSERFEKLLAVQNEIALEKNELLVGQTLRVLCEGVSKNNGGVYSGRTDSFKIVFFEGCEADTGTFVNIKINRAEAFALWGEKE